MNCSCGGDTKVVYTKHFTDRNFIRRRRECLECAKRFVTEEQLHHFVGERVEPEACPSNTPKVKAPSVKQKKLASREVLLEADDDWDDLSAETNLYFNSDDFESN